MSFRAQPGNPSIAARTFQLIADNPYRLTSDDVLFTAYADRAGLAESERPGARERYFSSGRPCLRASDLGKKYGWGIHANDDGRLALYAVDSLEYAALATDQTLQDETHLPAESHHPANSTVTVVKAMRTSRH